MISLEFILTSFIVVVIPGTGVIYTVSTAISGSRKAGILAVVGCTAGILPHLAACILGLSAILHTGAMIFQIIKIVGVVYLLYLSFGLLTSNKGFSIKDESRVGDAWMIVGKGILLNLLNPKLTLFFFSFLPQFVTHTNEQYLYQMIILSGAFMVLTFVIFLCYGILAQTCRKLFVDSPKIIRRIQRGFGVLLIGCAAKLALSDR